MKGISILLILLFCFGCSIATSIKIPEGPTYVINSKSDSYICFESSGTKIIVDNRGRPSFLETFFSAIVMSIPKVQIGDTD